MSSCAGGFIFVRGLSLGAIQGLNQGVECNFQSLSFVSELLTQRESPIVPRWVRLPGLPTNYFTPSCLKGIGNVISKFVKADERSLSKETPRHGRVCVEIDLSKEPPTHVWIGTSFDNGFWQRIVIEGRIDYCMCWYPFLTKEYS